MTEILRTNDPVLISFAVHLLRQAGCEPVVADEHISIMEGSIGAFPRRLLVPEDCETTARQVLRDADLGQWLTQERGDV